MASNNGYLTHCRICGTPIFSLGNRQFCSACYAQNRRNAAHRSNAEAKMRREQAKREEEKMKASNKTVTSAQELAMRAKLSEMGGISYGELSLWEMSHGLEFSAWEHEWETLDVQASIQKIDNKLKNIQEEKNSEKEKEEAKAEQQAEATPAGPNYNDDNDYPNFCGRLHIPAAGVDVALYNNTDQETCNREDSACVFPKAPQDGGSNIVADNEIPGLTSVTIGSTAYVITPSGEQINYVCVDACDGHNDVTGFDALQKNDGTVVWGTADLIVYTCLNDAYNVRIVCFNRA